MCPVDPEPDVSEEMKVETPKVETETETED